VQFIFTHCPTACPLLGSLFGKVQKSLDSDAGALLSITVDPERDTPELLTEWRKQFGTSSRWAAVRPDRAVLSKLLEIFGQKDGPPSGHALQVFYIDAGSRYVARTTDLPRAAGIANALSGRAEVAGINTRAVHESANLPLKDATGAAVYHRAEGVVPRIGGEVLAANAARCSNCHGEQGEGRSEGALAAAPLHRATLAGTQPRRGGPPSSYSRDTFCQSLRTGIDPAGIVLNAAMPRYTLSEESCTALWNFMIRK
jgi:cytochrome oxidase Cu insertion factor (SCO1/SenC/PrrC family)